MNAEERHWHDVRFTDFVALLSPETLAAIAAELDVADDQGDLEPGKGYDSRKVMAAYDLARETLAGLAEDEIHECELLSKALEKAAGVPWVLLQVH